jgi:GNAT superfamily N-acetyltransferase
VNSTVDLSERKLIRGWTSAPGVRVRQAGVADIADLEWIAELAGTQVEQPVHEAITQNTAGAGVRAGLRDGITGYGTFMTERFSGLYQHHADPLRAYLDAALVLVAEHRAHGVVGGLIAYPPITLVQNWLDIQKAAGASPQDMQKTLLGVGRYLTRIKTLAVAEHARGANIGGSLLKRARQIYFHLGYRTIYGAMPPTPGLDQFYRRAGFTVLDPGEPMDLGTMFGDDAQIFPDSGERLFLRQRPVG